MDLSRTFLQAESQLKSNTTSLYELMYKTLSLSRKYIKIKVDPSNLFLKCTVRTDVQKLTQSNSDKDTGTDVQMFCPALKYFVTNLILQIQIQNEYNFSVFKYTTGLSYRLLLN